MSGSISAVRLLISRKSKTMNRGENSRREVSNNDWPEYLILKECGASLIVKEGRKVR